MDDFKAGFETGHRNRFTRSGAIRMPRSVRLSLCRRFGPSPCPAHYGGRLTTTPSAGFCSLTHGVAAKRAARVTVGSGGVSRAFALALSPTPLAARAARELISPDKNVNFPSITAAFTLSPAPDGLRHPVLTRPGTDSSMRFLFVGSHVCARASSRPPLAGQPLPSARSFIGPEGHDRYSYRGLSPHEFTPLPGVHPPINLTCYSRLRRPPQAGYRQR